MFLRLFFLTLLSLFIFFGGQVYGGSKIVIAANGAGQDLIEDTLPAITLAAARNVDYLELHVVMTADDAILVFRDLTLNRLSNVATVFPERKRADGNYYVIDFSLDEIRRLRLRNVFEAGRSSLSLGIPTLQEELSLIRRLESILNRQIGIALEIRHPRIHRDSGKDISNATLDLLGLFGYTKEESKLYLQCFDPDELQRLHNRLLPEKKMHLPLIQLIGQPDGPEANQQQSAPWRAVTYDWMFTNFGLRLVAGYATAIGLPSEAVVDPDGTIRLGQFIQDIHKYGRKVLIYGVNSRDEQLPSFAADFAALLKFYYTQAGVDGVYTDSYLQVQQYNEQLTAEEKWRADLPTFFSPMEQPKPTTETEKPEAR